MDSIEKVAVSYRCETVSNHFDWFLSSDGSCDRIQTDSCLAFHSRNLLNVSAVQIFDSVLKFNRFCVFLNFLCILRCRRPVLFILEMFVSPNRNKYVSPGGVLPFQIGVIYLRYPLMVRRKLQYFQTIQVINVVGDQIFIKSDFISKQFFDYWCNLFEICFVLSTISCLQLQIVLGRSMHVR
jgi:hypothetical protein